MRYELITKKGNIASRPTVGSDAFAGKPNRTDTRQVSMNYKRKKDHVVCQRQVIKIRWDDAAPSARYYAVLDRYLASGSVQQLV